LNRHLPISLHLLNRHKGSWSGLQVSPCGQFCQTSALVDMAFWKNLVGEWVDVSFMMQPRIFPLFLWVINFLCFFVRQGFSVAQPGFELWMLLPQSTKCWFLMYIIKKSVGLLSRVSVLSLAEFKLLVWRHRFFVLIIFCFCLILNLFLYDFLFPFVTLVYDLREKL
jgi:hypothetical protein